MADTQELQREVSSLLAPLVDLRGAMPEIVNIVRNSVDLNFRVGGRTGSGEYGGGSEKWLPSDRVKEEGGQTLVDSGALAASIRYQIVENSIIVTSNLPYAATQFYGDPERGIDEHQYVVLQDEDLEAIQDVIGDYYGQML